MNKEMALRQYKAHTGNVNELHFKRIGANLLDVFHGEGLSTCSRYRLVKGTWVHYAGPKMDVSDVVAVLK